MTKIAAATSSLLPRLPSSGRTQRPLTVLATVPVSLVESPLGQGQHWCIAIYCTWGPKSRCKGCKDGSNWGLHNSRRGRGVCANLLWYTCSYSQDEYWMMRTIPTPDVVNDDDEYYTVRLQILLLKRRW